MTKTIEQYREFLRSLTKPGLTEEQLNNDICDLSIYDRTLLEVVRDYYKGAKLFNESILALRIRQFLKEDEGK